MLGNVKRHGTSILRRRGNAPSMAPMAGNQSHFNSHERVILRPSHPIPDSLLLHISSADGPYIPGNLLVE